MHKPSSVKTENCCEVVQCLELDVMEIERSSLCRGCLQYQVRPLQVHEEWLQDLYRCITNDYKNNEKLLLCHRCKHILTKVSMFKSMCLQSYLFLTKNLDCLKFDLDLLNEERSLAQNYANLSTTNTTCVSLLENDKNIIVVNYEEEGKLIKEEDEDDDDDDDFEDPLENEDDVEVPVEFDEKLKKEIKSESSVFDDLDNATEVMLSRAEQTEELEERRRSAKFINADFKCEKCALTFELDVVLQKHMLKHETSRGCHECWLCHLRYPNKYLLKAHTLLHSTRLVCKLCDYQANKRATMKSHLKWHAGVTYACEYCERVFEKRHALSTHLTKHKTEKGDHKCQQCGKIYSTKDALRQHEYFHTKKRMFSCEQCGKSFQTKGRLNYHSKLHSVKSGEHYCVECDISFRSEYSLKKHLDSTSKHRDPALLIFECKQCPKKFEREDQLHSHIQSSHERVARISCELCGARYVTQHGLNFHRRKAHQGYVLPLKYSCTTCDKQFVSSTQLKNHIRTHTGERPFECNLCSWKFTQKSSLRTHIKLKHLKIKRNAPLRKITKDEQSMFQDTGIVGEYPGIGETLL